MYVYVCEDESKPNFADSSQLIWLQRDLIYGDWTSGKENDGIYKKDAVITISPVIFLFTVIFYFDDENVNIFE